jgi:phage shock protein C
MNAGGRVWTRSFSGILAGVCKGTAQRFNLDVLVVRLVLILCVFCLGTGVLAYLILALSLPREDRLDKAYNSRLLGVCARFAMWCDIDVGLVRAGFLTLLVLSLGTMVFVYVLLWFILPSREECLKEKLHS